MNEPWVGQGSGGFPREWLDGIRVMVLCVRMNASGLFPSIAVGTVPIVLLNL